MRYLTEIFQGEYTSGNDCFTCHNSFKNDEGKKRVNILALGDVGSTLLMGLKLMGKDIIEEVGIFDINRDNALRYEMEMNQISYPFQDENENLPKVKVISEEELFQCDCFLFCASKGIPAVGKEKTDVRMVQYEENSKLVRLYAKMAKEKAFDGIFGVVSDPVDLLCMEVVKEGVQESQVRGFGLGVMNARAMYYADRDERFSEYSTQGRAFGPHGEGLVIADNVQKYNDNHSKELTKLAVKSNLETRKLGYKPYIAPAISSGAISVILMLKNRWHYSSIYFGRAFLGVKNRMYKDGTMVENIPLDDQLFSRIEFALESLENGR